jgi:hypothetical protein
VATDQTSRLIVDEPAPTAPAIENELPTYRAISSRAILSLLCGVLASFSFAHLFFLVFAVLAVLLGVLANIAIQRHPDMLTGRRLANAGIALGLVCGLVASTYTLVQNFVLIRAAENFSREYADALKNRSLGETLWYGLHPEMRKNKSPQQAQQDYESAKSKDRMMLEEKLGSLIKLRKRLQSSPNEKLHFIDLEGQGPDEGHGTEIGYYAMALYEVEGSGTAESPEKNQYALAIFKARSHGRRYEWWVDHIIYPYQPRTYLAPTKPVDDGHGHSH